MNVFRFAPVTLALVLASPAPSRAGWSIAYAPGVSLERFDAALLGRAQSTIDIASYLLTDVPVIDALAAAGARVLPRSLPWRRGVGELGCDVRFRSSGTGAAAAFGRYVRRPS